MYLVDFTKEEIAGCDACHSLIFERYTPIRLKDESIEDYCKRYDAMEGHIDPLISRDNKRLFEPFRQCFVDLSLCSVVEDAEFVSRGKSIFMDALLCQCCDTVGNEDVVESSLGVSIMQQNIIKTVLPAVIGFVGHEKLYKIMKGTYLSPVRTRMNTIRAHYDATNVSITMSAKEITRSFDFVQELQTILVTDVADEEGYVDSESVENEIAGYYGGEYEDLLKWLGIKG